MINIFLQKLELVRSKNLLNISFLSLGLFLTTFSVQAITPKAPSIEAKSYVLMDYYSGKVIAENNPDLPVAPASLTKMMTSYVVSAELVAGNITLNDLVTVSANAYAQNKTFEGSSLMWLEVGKTVLVSDLIMGLIISSGNDAAVALAEHVAGTEGAFAELMNYHAKKLGMTNSLFENAHGLSAKKHKTTAKDMAILAMALIRDFPEEYEHYKETKFTYNNIETYNRHPLLADPSINVDGIKTGHTDEAGYCLVSSATKDDMRLVSVVMGTSSLNARKVESKKILSFGFRFYETVKPLVADKVLHKAKVWMGEEDEIELGIAKDIFVTIPRGKSKALSANFVVEKEINAPINKGQRVGKVFFILENEPLAEYPLVALNDIKEAGFFGRTSDSISRWFGSLFN